MRDVLLVSITCAVVAILLNGPAIIRLLRAAPRMSPQTRLLNGLERIVFALTDREHPLTINATLGEGVTKVIHEEIQRVVDVAIQTKVDLAAAFVKAVDSQTETLKRALENQQISLGDTQRTHLDALRAIVVKLDMLTAEVKANDAAVAINKQTDVLRETQSELILVVKQQAEKIEKLEHLLAENIGHQKRISRAIEGKPMDDDTQDIIERAVALREQHPDLDIIDAMKRVRQTMAYRTS